MGGMNARPQSVSIVTMVDIGEGMDSFHYGGNVFLAPHKPYRVIVRVNGLSVLFKV